MGRGILEGLICLRSRVFKEREKEDLRVHGGGNPER